MSDEDNSSRTMSDESDVDSISFYDESDVRSGPMTVGERERLLVTALSALMSGSQNRLDYDLLAMQFPGRTSTDIQGEIDRMFHEQLLPSLGMTEEQGSMVRLLALERMRVEIEYQLLQWLESEMERWVEEILQEILEERFDALNGSAGTTSNEIHSSANAALTHSQQLAGGYQVNFDDDHNDSGYEGSMAGNGQVNFDDEQNDSGYESS